MKRNKTMRAAGLMLALVLITSCFVGGSFAKYTTNGTGTDSARVAKFGVTVTANGSTFAKEYKADDTTATTITNSVVSTENVVAPGTKGDMVSMTLAGTPEVAVKVTYEATTFSVSNWTVKDSENKDVFYCPLVITINGTDYSGLKYDDADAFETAVKNAIAGYSKTYAAGTDLSKQGDDSLSISWSWAFEADSSTPSTLVGLLQSDAYDTQLGNAAADNNAATISLSVTTTVTQID